jgi:2-phosphosulfolactate phosphatase
VGGQDVTVDDVDWFDQGEFGVRFDWGPNGLRRLAPRSDVVVIVDVLSFTTAVDVALGRGATVLPYRWHDGNESTYAAEHGAVVAGVGEAERWTLAPATLTDLPSGTRLVLPSPNGSALSFGAAEAGAKTVVAGCLRNAPAVAAWIIGQRPGVVSVLAAGERWKGDTGPLRPAVEDLLGAGAVLDALVTGGPDSDLSPEAAAARAAFRDAAAGDLNVTLHACGSGREKAAKGSSADTDLAAAHGASGCVPALAGAAFVDARNPSERVPE